MDFADASLVALSEQRPEAEGVTVDRDVLFYPRFGDQAIPVVRP